MSPPCPPLAPAAALAALCLNTWVVHLRDKAEKRELYQVHVAKVLRLLAPEAYPTDDSATAAAGAVFELELTLATRSAAAAATSISDLSWHTCLGPPVWTRLLGTCARSPPSRRRRVTAQPSPVVQPHDQDGEARPGSDVQQDEPGGAGRAGWGGRVRL